MAALTAAPPSTAETLAVRISGLEQLLKERDRRMDERFDSQALALRVATDQLSEYKTSANEWRATLSDVRSASLSRPEFDAKHQALESRINATQEVLLSKLDAVLAEFGAVKVRMAAIESTAANRVSSITIWLMGAGVVVAIVIGMLNLLSRMAR